MLSMYQLGCILCRFCDYFFSKEKFFFQGGLFCVQGVYVAGVVCYKCIGCIIDKFKEKAE